MDLEYRARTILTDRKRKVGWCLERKLLPWHEPEFVSVRVLEHGVGPPLFLRRFDRELHTFPTEFIVGTVKILDPEGYARIARFECVSFEGFT